MNEFAVVPAEDNNVVLLWSKRISFTLVVGDEGDNLELMVPVATETVCQCGPNLSLSVSVIKSDRCTNDWARLLRTIAVTILVISSNIVWPITESTMLADFDAAFSIILFCMADKLERGKEEPDEDANNDDDVDDETWLVVDREVVGCFCSIKNEIIWNFEYFFFN